MLPHVSDICILNLKGPENKSVKRALRKSSQNICEDENAIILWELLSGFTGDGSHPEHKDLAQPAKWRTQGHTMSQGCSRAEKPPPCSLLAQLTYSAVSPTHRKWWWPFVVSLASLPRTYSLSSSNTRLGKENRAKKDKAGRRKK